MRISKVIDDQRLGRVMTKNNSHFRFADFTFDPREGVLRKKGNRVPLRYQLSKLLELLIRRQGEIVTREEIKAGLWEKDTFIAFDISINTCVRSLRNALSDNASNPRFIETVPRRGYRFIYAVKEWTPVRMRVLAAVLPRRMIGGARWRGLREA